MKKPRKHEELIKKWASDNTLRIEAKSLNGYWFDANYPSWSDDVEYRIKPEVIRYRICLMKTNGYKWLKLLSNNEQEESVKYDLSFIEFKTDWIEVEV